MGRHTISFISISFCSFVFGFYSVTTMVKLIGMCNPLLDISATVSEDFLKKYDLKANNAILAEEKHVPLYDDLKKSYSVDYIAGGAGQNSMRVAQWMLQDMPGATAYFGAVGKDADAKTMATIAQKDGVDVRYYDEGNLPTGTCGVLITGNHRSLVANLAAANTYKVEHLKQAENWKLVEEAQFFYITGFFFTVSVDSIMAVGEHAAATNKTLCMNISAPFILEVPPFFAAFKNALPLIDVLFGNETEFETLAKAMGWTDCKGHLDIATRVARLPGKKSARPRTVVLTHGAEPTKIVVGDADRVWYSREFGVIPVSTEEIVDTNGAGDAFVGGFMSGLALGVDLEQCVARGNYAANVVIKRSGCAYPEKPSFKWRNTQVFC
eukprot:GDKH01013316.1.p1 GENE.GDKH01013316.1~~GDKH01013316.1.p1  ORF type:complete len:381 (-),score=107.72 GDKH01013316.1:260-1402(-)